MKIMVNAKEIEVAPEASIASLLHQLGMPIEHVAVERNGEIVEAENFAAVGLKAEDRLEIVHFVGGG